MKEFLDQVVTAFLRYFPCFDIWKGPDLWNEGRPFDGNGGDHGIRGGKNLSHRFPKKRGKAFHLSDLVDQEICSGWNTFTSNSFDCRGHYGFYILILKYVAFSPFHEFLSSRLKYFFLTYSIRHLNNTRGGVWPFKPPSNNFCLRRGQRREPDRSFTLSLRRLFFMMIAPTPATPKPMKMSVNTIAGIGFPNTNSTAPCKNPLATHTAK